MPLNAVCFLKVFWAAVAMSKLELNNKRKKTKKEKTKNKTKKPQKQPKTQQYLDEQELKADMHYFPFLYISIVY